MLTKEQVLQAIENGRESQAIDGRDYGRLCQFFTADEIDKFGYTVKEGAEHHQIEFTDAAVLANLAGDLAFAFEKALDQRGISASCMYGVIKMWMWILEDDLQHDEDYAQYGLPLLKKVAVKYSLPNPIGDNYGDEDEYAA